MVETATEAVTTWPGMDPGHYIGIVAIIHGSWPLHVDSDHSPWILTTSHMSLLLAVYPDHQSAVYPDHQSAVYPGHPKCILASARVSSAEDFILGSGFLAISHIS